MPTILGRRYPDKVFEYRATVPTSPTDIATKTTYVTKIRVVNDTAGALNFDLDDKTPSTPIQFYDAVPIAAQSVSLESPAVPVKFTGGINIQASGSGLTAEIEGFQEP